jgi:hypothetical protein
MAYLNAQSVREHLRSVAWQSSALQRCKTLDRLRRESSSQDTCEEFLNDEEMAKMMCGLL